MDERIKFVTASSPLLQGKVPGKTPALAGALALQVLGLAVFMTVVTPVKAILSLIPETIEQMCKELGNAMERAFDDFRKDMFGR
jgi:hypothetical protein